MKVQLKDVHKEFKKEQNQKLQVLDDINFDIKEGEFVSLLGPSGCGKSTILKLIAGLETTTAGEVLVNGKAVNKPGTDRIVVFQEGGLFPWMTVKENVSYGLNLKKCPKQK